MKTTKINELKIISNKQKKILILIKIIQIQYE